jgi:hypothetical protein
LGGAQHSFVSKRGKAAVSIDEIPVKQPLVSPFPNDGIVAPENEHPSNVVVDVAANCAQLQSKMIDLCTVQATEVSTKLLTLFTPTKTRSWISMDCDWSSTRGPKPPVRFVQQQKQTSGEIIQCG